MWRPTASRVLLHGDEDLHDPQNNNAQSKRSKSQNTLEALHHKRKTPRVCDSRRAALQQRRNSSQCAISLLASLNLDYIYSHGSCNTFFFWRTGKATCMNNRSMPLPSSAVLPSIIALACRKQATARKAAAANKLTMLQADPGAPTTRSSRRARQSYM
jgi:hypothetical protein